MTLTDPSGLLGLLTLPLILALHLLWQRSRRQVVSSLSLWEFLDVQVRGRRARRIPVSWLLLIDLLIATALSLALAGPKLDLGQSVTEAVHAIYLLDVSTSMGAVDLSPSRFAKAQTELTSALRGLNPQDLATVITVGPSARVLGDTRSQEIFQLIERVQSLQPAGNQTNLEAGLALADAVRTADIPAVVHIFSDGGFPEPEWEDSTIPVVWHILGDQAENQAVVGISTTALSERKVQVFARFANFSSEAVTRNGALYSDGGLVTAFEISLEPRSSVARTWDVVGSPAFLQVVLGGEDQLPADDSATLGLNPSETLEVALVTNDPGPVLPALEAIPQVTLTQFEPEDYLVGSPFDLVVFRRALPERWPAGPVLILDPPPNSDLLGDVDRVQIRTQPFPRSDILFTEVDFTGVRWSEAWQLVSPPADLDPLLTAGSLPLILRGQVGVSQLLFILPVIADQNGTPTAFARHPAFPVLMANAVTALGEPVFPDQLAVGDPLLLPVDHRFLQLEVFTPEARFRLDPALRRAFDRTQTPGVYRVVSTDLDGKERETHVGLNAGDLLESDILAPQFVIPEDPAVVAGLSNPDPRPLAPWLLGLVGFLLLLQAWLSWR